MDKLFHQIKELNTAYIKLSQGIKTLEKYTVINPDLNTHLYRMKKSIDEFQKCLLKHFKDEQLQEEFKKIIKGWDIK